MNTFTVRDLREHTGELIRGAENGELSVITKHGTSFTRSFERMTGRSPKNWRAEHGPLRSIALRNPEV